MSAIGVTPRQRRLLAFITAEVEAGRSPPTFDEMAAHMGLASKSGIHRLISGLEERGHVRRLPNRARAIALTDGPAAQVIAAPAAPVPPEKPRMGIPRPVADQLSAYCQRRRVAARRPGGRADGLHGAASMSALRITPAQIRAIHAIKTRTGLDDGSYRAMLGAYGVDTSKNLRSDDADRLLVRMRQIPGASARSQRDRASGKYAGKLQAMWLALYNLGVVADRRDSAMHRFLERQTGVEHTRFLQEAAEAHKAIEALKSWMIREGVVWPVMTGDTGTDRMAMKRAVLRAQWCRLVTLGKVRTFGDPAACDGLAEYVSAVVFGSPRRIGSIDAPTLEAEQLDSAAAALGAKIRKAQTPAEVRHAG